jgi:hypothetical protein
VRLELERQLQNRDGARIDARIHMHIHFNIHTFVHTFYYRLDAYMHTCTHTRTLSYIWFSSTKLTLTSGLVELNQNLHTLSYILRARSLSVSKHYA